MLPHNLDNYCVLAWLALVTHTTSLYHTYKKACMLAVFPNPNPPSFYASLLSVYM